MCTINSEQFFRPWSNEEILAKSSIDATMTENHHMKSEFEDVNDCISLSSSSSTISNDSPTTGSLSMLSNFVMNSGLSQNLNHQNNQDNCEIVNTVNKLKINSSPCDSCSSTTASPKSAFVPPPMSSSPYDDYLSNLRNDLMVPYDPSTFMQFSAPQLYCNLASLPLEHYKKMAEAVNFVRQQEIVDKQIKKQRPKKFRCERCDVAFSNNGQLKGHIRIHTGERPYKCDAENCGKCFTRNEELTRHKRIHTGVKPHPCIICGKCFGRKDHLKKHTRTHENRHGHFHLSPAMTPFNIHPASLISVTHPSAHAISPYMYSLPPEHINY